MLGSESKLAFRDNQTSIAMINCGHLFCTDCLVQHVQEKLGSHQLTTCSNCRKRFTLAIDVMYIDHRQKDEEDLLAKDRETAKQIVREENSREE